MAMSTENQWLKKKIEISQPCNGNSYPENLNKGDLINYRKLSLILGVA